MDRGRQEVKKYYICFFTIKKWLDVNRYEKEMNTQKESISTRFIDEGRSRKLWESNCRLWIHRSNYTVLGRQISCYKKVINLFACLKSAIFSTSHSLQSTRLSNTTRFVGNATQYSSENKGLLAPITLPQFTIALVDERQRISHPLINLIVIHEPFF